MLSQNKIYHTILLDIDLGEHGNGIEFTKEIRAREEKESIKRTVIVGMRCEDEEELE